MAQQRKVDVVIVGTGFTGAILGYELAAAGLEVVALERGREQWTNPDFRHNHDHLRYSQRFDMMQNLGRETWTWRPNPKAPSLPMRQYGSFNPGTNLGGASVHWNAQNWRFLPYDFRYRSHHIERYGEGKLPAGSRVQDWGITYEELEPYYDQYEYDVGISGQTGNLNGEILPGGNPFEAPRRRPYPLPPLETSIVADMFAGACRDLGYHPFPQPAAILSRGYTGLSGIPRAACIYCGHCVRFGCEVDAKVSSLTDHLPAALATGRFQIRYGSNATGITVGPDGLATGVSYVDGSGSPQEQPADIVVLAAFTLSNVRLLLLSQSSAHPGGVGNDRQMVGKNYTYQISKDPVSAVFQGRKFNQFMGNGCVINVIFDFYGDNFDHADLDFIGGGRINSGAGARDPLGSVLGGVPQGTGPDAEGSQSGSDANVLDFSGREWGQAWKENLRRNWDGAISVGFEGDSLPYEDQFLDLDPVYKDANGLPLLRITFDFHDNERNLYRFIAQRCQEITERMGPSVMETTPELAPYNIHEYQSTHNTGGAIMGSDPASSVVNKYSQVWDTPNVFVLGASNFPQNPGANPTGTICALAYHTAAAIKARYLDDPNRLMS
jgi:gluconate 2-dehydrogenase alpha chain